LKKKYFSSHKLPTQQSTSFWSQGILGVNRSSVHIKDEDDMHVHLLEHLMPIFFCKTICIFDHGFVLAMPSVVQRFCKASWLAIFIERDDRLVDKSLFLLSQKIGWNTTLAIDLKIHRLLWTTFG
jgi:hypothetical protein